MSKEIVMVTCFGNTNLMGELVEENDEKIILKNVMNIVFIPTQAGMQIGQIPFNHKTVELKELTVDKKMVLCVDDAQDLYDDMLKQRIQQQHGIKMPSEEEVSKIIKPN